VGDTQGDAPAAATTGSGEGTPDSGTPPAGDAPDTQGGAAPGGTHNPADTGSTPAPATEGGDKPPETSTKGKAGKAKPAEPSARSGPDLTRRLADMSRDNREHRKALADTTRELESAHQRLADFDGLIKRSQAGDGAAIEEIYNRFGLSFEKIVDYHAGKPDPTPEQARDAEVAALRAELKADKEARQQEQQQAQQAMAQQREAAARAEYVGMCGQHIKAAGDQAEICGRLGDEAAEAVFGKVIKAWGDAGRPELMPGELEEAIDKAIEVQELEYEKRGQLLVKKLNGTNGTNGHANGAAKTSDLPAGLTGGKLSDTDETILNGLIDKSAPGEKSQRAKPRSISSQMGGSAPPKTAPRGGMDAREALRATLADFNLTPR